MKKGLQFGTRHVQCFIIFLGVVASFCVRGHIAVAIVSMTEKSGFNDAPVMEWDSRMKGFIQSSFYWSYILIVIPGGQMSEKFGPKILLVSAMFICGIVLFLTPFMAIYGGFYCMLVSRILQGATQAFIFPSINVLLSKWAPIREKGLLCGCVFSGMEFGSVVSMAMAGVLVDSRWGWPSVFYACGCITMTWALLYAYVGENSPRDHKTISEYEKMYILGSLPHSSQERDNLKTPWKAIMSSAPLRAIAIAHCAENWGFYTILSQAPTYINAVLGFNMKKSGFLVALPYLSSCVAINAYAYMNYWLYKNKIQSKNTLLKFWNTLGFWGPSLALCFLAFAGKNETLVVVLVIVAVTLNSAERVGFETNHIDLSPNFAGTLMGITTACATISTFGAPLYAGFVVTDPKSEYSWRIVFLTAATVLFIGNLIFITYGTADVQPWNFLSTKVKPDLEGAISEVNTTKEKRKSLE